MSSSLFTSPIDDSSWTMACGNGKCCIEVAHVAGGGFALRNTQAPNQIIRASADELKAFQTLIPGLVADA